MPHTPTHTLINLEDVVKFERNPIRETINSEVTQQTSVGNGRFTGGDDPELMDERGRIQDPEALAAQLGAIFDLAQPAEEVNALTPAERQRQRRLTRRAERLRPIEASEEPISRRIAGNPFSIEIGPGLRQLATAVVNRERTRRVQGDPQAAEAAQRRIQNAQTQIDSLSQQIAATDDPGERRRLERQQARLMRRLERDQARAERYQGFAGELVELNEQEQRAEAARQANAERQGERGEFIAEQTAEALQKNLQSQADQAEERQKQQNRIALQRDLYKLKEGLEEAKAKLESGGGAGSQREYASIVNNYVRTYLGLADSYDNDIRQAQRLQETLGVTPGKYRPGEAPEDAKPAEIGDPEYYVLQDQIEAAQQQKKQVLQNALKIFENSTLLSPTTRVMRPPTEEEKQFLATLREAGVGEERLAEVARRAGFEYTPQTGTEGAPESGQLSQPGGLSIGDVAGQFGFSEAEYVAEYARQNGLSETEARQNIQTLIESGYFNE